MSRLQTEFDRLYAPPLAEPPASGGEAVGLMGPSDEVRALVLEIGKPADWELAGRVWREVQTALDLPAPGIAISGADGFQLWFSLAHAVPAVQGHAFLDELRRRCLAELPASRVKGFPRLEQGDWVHAAVVPANVAMEQWSAFVAQGLAPVFADTPWLDFPPSEDGQADLLRGLDSISDTAWSDALERLHLRAPDRPVALAPLNGPVEAQARIGGPSASSGPLLDPRQFLLQVMNDERVALPLRIDAAKALLPYTAERPPGDPAA